jgi:hypothetical protein
MLRGGSTTGEIAAHFGRSSQAIRDLQKKIIYRKFCAPPKMEYSQLAKEAMFVYLDGTTSKPPSRTTLWRIIKKHGPSKHHCKKRPKLAKEHARERLLFSHK